MRKDFIYLASASPRRAELLRQIGVPFRVMAAELSETRRISEPGENYVTRLAVAKADQIWDELGIDEHCPVLGADTAVVIEGQVFGKPENSDDACKMLGVLSGKTHRVLTAVALRYASRSISRLCSSEVSFRSTTESERRAYVATGEPLDKAGAYAIQGLGAVFIDHLAGSYSSTMGLPLAATAALLGEFGLPAWLYSDDKSA
jgi:septum formation protein